MANHVVGCRFADTPEEKARKLAKKTCLPPSKVASYDLLQSLAGQYQLTMDGMHPGLPAGFTGFSATGIPDGGSKHLTNRVHSFIHVFIHERRMLGKLRRPS